MNGIIDIIIQIKLLSLHTSRLADLVLEKLDTEDHVPDKDITCEGNIRIENLSFSYSDYENFVVKNINLVIDEGDFLAIQGKSGCGKSTFLKLILGLYKPTYGKVLFDDVSTKNIGVYNLRKSVGCVLQNDQLFSGSIVDNVSFFAENIDLERVNECLSIAEFSEDIKKLPMGIHTEVGNFFSAGQVQRILIARALYKSPRILILDEPTSNLNVELEKKILNNLKLLNLTIVFVSHRPSIVKIATKTYDLQSKTII